MRDSVLSCFGTLHGRQGRAIFGHIRLLRLVRQFVAHEPEMGVGHFHLKSSIGRWLRSFFRLDCLHTHRLNEANGSLCIISGEGLLGHVHTHFSLLEDRCSSVGVFTAHVSTICPVTQIFLIIIRRLLFGVVTILLREVPTLTLRTEGSCGVLIVKSHTTRCLLLRKGIYSSHVCLKQVVFVFDPVFDKILELFHLDLHNDLVDVRVTVSVTIEISQLVFRTHLLHAIVRVSALANALGERYFFVLRAVLPCSGVCQVNV